MGGAVVLHQVWHWYAIPRRRRVDKGVAAVRMWPFVWWADVDSLGGAS